MALKSTRPTRPRPCAARTRTAARATSDHRPPPNHKPRLPAAAERAAALCLSAIILAVTPLDADALLASPKRDLPRSAEAALRRSIPSFNPHVAALQSELESVQRYLRIPQRKPWASMATSTQTAFELASDGDACLRGVLPPDIEKAHEMLDGIQSDLSRLQRAIDVKDPERTSIRVANALERLGEIELLQSPGLKYQLPARYANLPRLTGRAVLEMTVAPQAGGSKQVIELTLDGFSAPLTSGRMLQNVIQKKYDGTIIRADDTSIFVDTDKGGAALEGDLPLEIFARGDFEPVYRTELDVNDFDEIPLLPLSVDGALAATRAGDGTSSSKEFFIYKYNRSQSGLAGLSFDEGKFAVFGYVTSDRDVVRLLNDGDRIERIRALRGADKLINLATPDTPSTAETKGEDTRPE